MDQTGTQLANLKTTATGQADRVVLNQQDGILDHVTEWLTNIPSARFGVEPRGASRKRPHYATRTYIATVTQLSTCACAPRNSRETPQKNRSFSFPPFETTQHAELSDRRHAEISDVALDGLLGPTQRAFT
jgi:hypothetical protein